MTTVIGNVPTTVRSLAGTVAVSWVADTNVVVNGVPFQSMVAPETKLVPLTVSLNDA